MDTCMGVIDTKAARSEDTLVGSVQVYVNQL